MLFLGPRTSPLVSCYCFVLSSEGPHSSLETDVFILLSTFCFLSDILHAGDSRWLLPSRWKHCRLSVFRSDLWASEAGVCSALGLVLWQITTHTRQNTKMAPLRTQAWSRTAHVAATSDWEEVTFCPGQAYMWKQSGVQSQKAIWQVLGKFREVIQDRPQDREGSKIGRMI